MAGFPPLPCLAWLMLIWVTTVFTYDRPVFLGVSILFRFFRKVSGKRLPVLVLKTVLISESWPKAY
jgi:hypothetical protein